MLSKNLHLNFVIRIIFLTLFSVLLGYLIFVAGTVRLSLLCLAVIIIVALGLLRLVNDTNRKAWLFFESVRNDDANLVFASSNKNETISRLYESMNRVNHQIQELKIENVRKEQQFRSLIEHIGTGIITCDSRGIIHHVNSAVLKMLAFDVLTHVKQIERFDPKLASAVSSIKPGEQRLVTITSGKGETELSIRATSVKVDSAELKILSVQDIRNELEEREIESWLKLIRILMHEIMNSITPITSISESLCNIYRTENGTILPGTVTDRTVSTTLQGLDVIREQGKGLMSFVESYRELTRIPEPERKLFHVSDLFARIRIVYSALPNSSRTRFLYEEPAEDLEIFADQNLISQVLVNIVKNALESVGTDDQGFIRLGITKGEMNHHEITVSDNGPGIPEENIDKIFIPFFSTRNDGNGIGLSISRQIMKAHGGSLKVKSIPGKETVFSLVF